MADMTQHTHIAQGARLPEECPACAVVWKCLSVLDYYVDFPDEFRTARSLRSDYGESEMVNHLTRVMEEAQVLLYRIGN